MIETNFSELFSVSEMRFKLQDPSSELWAIEIIVWEKENAL